MQVWMLWTLAGLVLLVLEVPSQSFYLMWFGIGAFCAAGASLFFAVPVQLLVFFGVSIGTLLLLRPVTYRLLYLNTPHFDTNADRMVGQVATSVETIDNLKGTGVVKLYGAGYSALSCDDDVVIEPGQKVRVYRVTGAKLVVAPVDRIHPESSKEG